MTIAAPSSDAHSGKSRLAVLLEHFAYIEAPRDVRRILRPLREVLLVVVCPQGRPPPDHLHAVWSGALQSQRPLAQ